MAITFDIERSTAGPSGPWTVVSTVSASPKQLTGQPAATTLWYRVKRYEDAVLTNTSNVIAVATLDVPTAFAEGERDCNPALRIRVSWLATCATKYRVYRFNPVLGTFSLLASVTGVNEFYDYAISWDVTYFYAVAAVTDDELSESAKSNIVAAYVHHPQGVFCDMATRPTALQGIQVAPEVSRGVMLPATKRLLNMQVMPTPVAPAKQVRYPGSLATTDVQSAKSHTEAAFEGAMDFNLLAYIFTMMFGTVAPSTVGTNGKKRVWRPDPTANPVPQTFTIETGSTLGAEKFPGGFISEVRMSWNQTDADIEGSMFGQKLVRQTSLTSLTEAARVSPFAIDPKNISVFYSVDAGANYTRLRDTLAGNLGISGLFRPVFHVDDSHQSWDDIIVTTPEISFELVMDEGPESAVLEALRDAGTLFWLGVRAVGPVIDAGSSQIADPTVAPTMATADTGGTILPGTYIAGYTWKNATGDTKISPLTTIVVPAGTNTNTITLTAPTLPVGATGINAFLGTELGDIAYNSTSGTNSRIMTAPNAAGAVAPPSVNTTATGLSYYLLRLNMPVYIITPDLGDQDGVWGATFNLVGAHGVRSGDTAASLIDLELTNALASL